MRTSKTRAALLAIALLAPSVASADVCVWRDPERTMTKLFPSATDYRTVTKRITPDIARQIEQRIGSQLDATERVEFNYYEVTGRPGGETRRLGTVLALAGRGEYGAIEVVIGLDPEQRIVGVYIQRMRERQAENLRADEFLGQFRGKSHGDPLEPGRDIRVVPEAPAASRVVALAVKKMLAFYDVLT